MRKPICLRPGDTIGIVAPSSPVPEDELRQGIALLEARGYRVEIAPNVLATAPHCNYLAGTDLQRAADLNTMLVRPDIEAVLCARGGYGSMRLFDLLDWETIAANPKVFVGYSDITSLHTALARFGWVTFHSTMASSLHRLDAQTLALFFRLIEQPDTLGVYPADPKLMHTVVPGVAEGELAGGNICLLASACGSRFAPDFKDKIVLLEDVKDPVYRADRDLTQLLNAGILQQAAGFVIGTLSGWEECEARPPLNTPAALWHELFGRLGKPAISDFPFGHIANPLPIPLGVRARLDAGARTVTLLEPAVLPRPL